MKRGAHHNTGRYGARRAQNAYEISHANSIKKSRRFLSSKFVSWVVKMVLEKCWSLTSDNGSEFAELAELENNTTTKVYFAHPYSSWERVSNERHNGLLRRMVPKGKRIDKYTSDDILFTADWCNLLPRRILEYKTPDDLFENELDKICAV